MHFFVTHRVCSYSSAHIGRGRWALCISQCILCGTVKSLFCSLASPALYSQWGRGKMMTPSSRKGPNPRWGAEGMLSWSIECYLSWLEPFMQQTELPSTPPTLQILPFWPPFPSLLLVLHLSLIHLHSIYSATLQSMPLFCYTFAFSKKMGWGAFMSPSALPCLWDGWMVSQFHWAVLFFSFLLPFSSPGKGSMEVKMVHHCLARKCSTLWYLG